MATISQPFLFDWDFVDEMPDIQRIQLVLNNLPDEELVRKLRQNRGKGRNDYPIRAMWNFVVTFMLTGHRAWSDHLRELQRNRDLARVCGFSPLGSLPTGPNVSRFLDNLLKEDKMIQAVFHKLVELVMTAWPELGAQLAVDSKAIASVAGRRSERNKQDGTPDRRGEHDAAIGKKTKFVEKVDGTAEEKLFEWFGFKLHLVVDTASQLPVAYQVTQGLSADTKQLLPLLAGLKENHAELLERCTEVCADKAYDDEANIVQGKAEYGVDVLCPTRKLWKNTEQQTKAATGEPILLRLLDGQGKESLAYDQDGQVYCWYQAAGRKEGEHYPMVYKGYEADRDSVKYICPAQAKGFACANAADCPFAAGQVRIKLATDRRILVPLPRHTLKFQRRYNGRTAVERVNGMLDNVFGLEWHTIRGLAMTRLRVGLALSAMLAMALGRIRNGQPARLRSMVRPAA